MKKNPNNDDEIPEDLRDMMNDAIEKAWRMSRKGKLGNREPKVLSTHQLPDELATEWAEIQEMGKEAERIATEAAMRKQVLWADIKEALDLYGLNPLKIEDDGKTLSELEKLPEIDKMDVNFTVERLKHDSDEDEDNDEDDDKKPAQESQDFF